MIDGHRRGHYRGFTRMTRRFSSALALWDKCSMFTLSFQYQRSRDKIKLPPVVALVLEVALVQHRCLQSEGDCLQSPCDSAEIFIKV